MITQLIVKINIFNILYKVQIIWVANNIFLEAYFIINIKGLITIIKNNVPFLSGTYKLIILKEILFFLTF